MCLIDCPFDTEIKFFDFTKRSLTFDSIQICMPSVLCVDLGKQKRENGKNILHRFSPHPPRVKINLLQSKLPFRFYPFIRTTNQYLPNNCLLLILAVLGVGTAYFLFPCANN